MSRRRIDLTRADRCIYDSSIAEQLQLTFKDGHAIGNHMWSHPDAAKLNQSAFYSEVRRVDTALTKILGVKPALFRCVRGR